MNPSIRVAMLGPFHLWRNGVQVAEEDWPTQKSKSLIKILLQEHGHLVPADRLIETLWPNLPIRKAQNNLWVSISQARRVLQPELSKPGASDFILRAPEGYSFNFTADVWLDVDAFESALHSAQRAAGWPARIQSLESARALYGGEYLEDDPYEEWALSRREELRSAFLGLLDDLAEAYARLGRYRRAIALCRELLSLDRTRETAYQKLMVYHYQAGEQPHALKVFDECRQALQAELGVDPSPETYRLHTQIQRRRLEAGPSSPVYSTLEEDFAGEHVLSTTEFVGRSPEYERLSGLVHSLVLNNGAAALIAGEPGIGKSRLVQEVVAHARQHGLHSLSLSCYPIEQATPFQPVVELVDQAYKTWQDPLFAGLPPADLAEIATLYPELARLAPSRPNAPIRLDEARQALLFKALARMLAAASGEAGLILAIEDLHWADHATLSFIHHLVRQASQHPFLLLLTYRPEEIAADPFLSDFIHSLKRSPRLHQINLLPLTTADIDQVLEPLAEAGEARSRLAAWLYTETEGNPFFLVTILQSMLEQGLLDADDKRLPVDWLDTGRRVALPEALLDSVRDRLRRAPEPARQVLQVAAVIGRRFEFGALQAVNLLPQADLLAAIEELLRRGLLREDDDGRHYDFSHDKIREVVYRDMSRLQRLLLHAKVAESIEARAPGDDGHSCTLAEHYTQAQDWPRAVHYLGKAAERSRQLFALQEAVGFLDRAIEIAGENPEAVSVPGRFRLYEQRGEARMQAGEFHTAAADLELALEDARSSQDLTREQSLLVNLGILYRREDILDRAADYLNRALETARRLDDQSRVADTLYHLGTVVWSQGENIQAEGYHQEAVHISRQLDPAGRIAAQALHGLGEARWIAGDFVEAYQLFHESLELSQRLGDRGLENENLHNLGALHGDELAANYRQAKSYLQQSLKMLDETALAWHRMPALFSLGLVTGFMGDYERGFRYIHQALDESRRRHSPRYYAAALDFLGCLYRDLNLLEKAAAAFSEGLETSRAVGIDFWSPRLQANLAITHIRQGDQTVGSLLTNSLEAARRRGQGIHVAVCLQGLAELSTRQGDFEHTRALCAELADLAAYGMHEVLAQAHRWRGEALAGLGQRAQAEAALLQAAALAAPIEKPRLAWEIHTALESAYLRWGEPDSADLHRRQAATAAMAITRKLNNPALREGVAGFGVGLPAGFVP